MTDSAAHPVFPQRLRRASRRLLTRFAVPLAAAATLLGAAAPAAHAGYFTITQCSGGYGSPYWQGIGGASPSSGASIGVACDNNAYFYTQISYPANTGYWGSWAAVALPATNLPANAFIAGYTASVYLTKAGGGQDFAFASTNASYPTPTSYAPINCPSGSWTGNPSYGSGTLYSLCAGDTYGSYWPAQGTWGTWSQGGYNTGFNTRTISFGEADDNCIASSGDTCNGNTTNYWQVNLGIQTTSGPSLSSGGGSMWCTNCVISGTGTVSWTASDGTGILQNRVDIDGVAGKGGDATYSCNYDYEDPCAYGLGGNPYPSFSYNTTGLADGPHTITLYSENTGGDWSAPATTTFITDNYPPTNTALPAVSGTPTVGQTLSSTTGSWTNNNNTNYTYQWQDCTTSSASSCASIPGATSSTYTEQWSDYGYYLRSVVQLCDPIQGCRSAASPTSAAVQGYYPTNTVAPTISGVAKQGQTFSSTPGSWANNTNTNYTYQWQDCAANGTSCTPIPGATGSTYTSTASDLGHTIYLTVTLCNPDGLCTHAMNNYTGGGSANPGPISLTGCTSVTMQSGLASAPLWPDDLADSPTVTLAQTSGSGVVTATQPLAFQVNASGRGAIRSVIWRLDDQLLPGASNYTLSIPMQTVVSGRRQVLTATVFPREETTAGGTLRAPVVLSASYTGQGCY